MSKPRVRTPAVPLPAWYDLTSKDPVGFAYLRDSLTDGDLLEFRIGRGADAQGTGLLVTGRSSRVTRRGVWVDGVLLGCTDNGWRSWFTNHGDAESPDMSGLFHMCAEAPCRAKSSGASTAQVHITEFRVLSTKQAESLGYASEGLKALATELDGSSLEEPAAATPVGGAIPATDATDSADETAALRDVGAGTSPGRRRLGP